MGLARVGLSGWSSRLAPRQALLPFCRLVHPLLPFRERSSRTLAASSSRRPVHQLTVLEWRFPMCSPFLLASENAISIYRSPPTRRFLIPLLWSETSPDVVFPCLFSQSVSSGASESRCQAQPQPLLASES